MVPFKETIETQEALIEAVKKGYEDYRSKRISKNDFCMFFGFTHGKAITKFYPKNYGKLLTDGGFNPGSEAYFSGGVNAWINLNEGKYEFPPLDNIIQLNRKDNMIGDITNLDLLTALRTKPFLLLAGISGTGKSRIVRELAKSCWKADEENTDFGNNCPRNFCMVQVKPNWHDSSELMGYVSRIGEKPVFVTGEFLKFVTRAWQEPDKPYFLCLDEMNLAPVEQYFAEYLSVIESRKRNNDGSITTDPILKKEAEEWYHTLISNLTEEEALRKKFLEEGIALPQNLFVIGTVNMDETTFSFSRKVLDRAMTIEMNEVDLNGGLDENAPSEFGYIGDWLKCVAVEGKDVYADNKDLCDKVITYLEGVNAVLEGTPFKIAYRTRNEFLIYAVHRGEDNLANALDEMTSMKILSRIEGDADKIGNLLDRLESVISPQVQEENSDDEHPAVMSVSLKKLDEMKKKLSSGYTSFWS